MPSNLSVFLVKLKKYLKNKAEKPKKVSKELLLKQLKGNKSKTQTDAKIKPAEKAPETGNAKVIDSQSQRLSIKMLLANFRLHIDELRQINSNIQAINWK